jgi:hypothetical protein
MISYAVSLAAMPSLAVAGSGAADGWGYWTREVFRVLVELIHGFWANLAAENLSRVVFVNGIELK